MIIFGDNFPPHFAMPAGHEIGSLHSPLPASGAFHSVPLICALLPEWFVPSKVPEALPHFVVLSTQFLLLAFVLPGLGALPRRFCPSCRPARQPLFTLLPIFLLKFPAVDLPLLFVPSLGRRGLEADGVTTILSFLVFTLSFLPKYNRYTTARPGASGIAGWSRLTTSPLRPPRWAPGGGCTGSGMRWNIGSRAIVIFTFVDTDPKRAPQLAHPCPCLVRIQGGNASSESRLSHFPTVCC